MTPKDKAKQLYDRYCNMSSYCDDANECALITVDEIMKAIGWDEMELGVDRDNYWTEVKQEIEKL
jgi:hypothetical protein